MTVELMHGDCLHVMAEMAENSIDTIITDPPYGYNFMSASWDHGVPGAPYWKEALRVARPGAMMLAFGGTRTHHRLMCAIEDAGWVIRDCMMWLYGSGFPKSHDISKAIDKAAGAERTKTEWRDRYHDGQTRQELGSDHHQHNVGLAPTANGNTVSLPATPEATTWDGYGTALKPAWEPIILAMKPLDGTFAHNALTWGVGGFNIDGGRVGTDGGGTRCNNRDEHGNCLGHPTANGSLGGGTMRHAHLTGQRPCGILPGDNGGISWEDGQNLCGSCASRVGQNKRHTAQAKKECSATSPAEPIMSGKAETSPVGTNRLDIGCSDGMRQGDTSTSLSTGECGKMPTGQSQKGMLSTTSTQTRKTTDSKTCSLCGAEITIIPISGKAGRPHPTGATEPKGRWPANLILSHSPECRRVGVRKVKGEGGRNITAKKQDSSWFTSDKGQWQKYHDPDGTETVEAWECVEGCPVAMLDAQSGERPMSGRHGENGSGKPTGLFEMGSTRQATYWDTGGASRFFQHCNWGEDDVRFRYQAKASRRDRNHGLDSTRTVKYNRPKFMGGLLWDAASTELVRLLRKATLEPGTAWHTGESGESITGLCHVGSLSTTLTAISRITISQILLSLTPLLTNASIPDANLETACGGNPVTSAESSSPSTRHIGTFPKRGGLSTDDASRVISELLSTISDGENWHELTNTHSTVKPLALMRYLVKLTKTPTLRDVILDPFMGSGSTGVAAILEGRDFVGIELGAESYDIATRRIEAAQSEVVQLELGEVTK